MLNAGRLGGGRGLKDFVYMSCRHCEMQTISFLAMRKFIPGHLHYPRKRTKGFCHQCRGFFGTNLFLVVLCALPFLVDGVAHFDQLGSSFVMLFFHVFFCFAILCVLMFKISDSSFGSKDFAVFLYCYKQRADELFK